MLVSQHETPRDKPVVSLGAGGLESRPNHSVQRRDKVSAIFSQLHAQKGQMKRGALMVADPLHPTARRPHCQGGPMVSPPCGA